MKSFPDEPSSNLKRQYHYQDQDYNQDQDQDLHTGHTRSKEGSKKGRKAKPEFKNNSIKSAQNQSQQLPQLNKIKLFVGGLQGATSEEQVFNYFSKFGEVTSVSLVKAASESDFSAGFGFITLKSLLAMDTILSYRHCIDGNIVDCQSMVDRQAAKAKEMEEMDRKLFVGGLSTKTDDNKLKNFFQKFGAVQKAYVVKDYKSGKSRGFGFVLFEDPSSIEEARKIKKHFIDNKLAHIKVSRPKDDERGQQLQKEDKKPTKNCNVTKGGGSLNFKKDKDQNKKWKSQNNNKVKEELSYEKRHLQGHNQFKSYTELENGHKKAPLSAYTNLKTENKNKNNNIREFSEQELSMMGQGDLSCYIPSNATPLEILTTKINGYLNHLQSQLEPMSSHLKRESLKKNSNHQFYSAKESPLLPYNYIQLLQPPMSSQEFSKLESPLFQVSATQKSEYFNQTQGTSSENQVLDYKSSQGTVNETIMVVGQQRHQDGLVGDMGLPRRVILGEQKMSKTYSDFEKIRLGRGYKDYCRIEDPVQYCKDLLKAGKRKNRKMYTNNKNCGKQTMKLSNGFLELSCRLVNSTGKSS